MLFLSEVSEYTFTVLSIAAAKALEPCTTKCSPEIIILPGASAMETKLNKKTHYNNKSQWGYYKISIKRKSIHPQPIWFRSLQY